MAIFASFNSSTIHRLSRTWSLLNSKYRSTFDALQKLLSSDRNFSLYRKTLAEVEPPCVPFIGIYLTDLTFVKNGVCDFLPNNEKLLNFSKYYNASSILNQTIKYQVPYNLQKVDKIQKYIETELAATLDEAKLYSLSIQLEPRSCNETEF
jgi:son of sevenless